MKRATGLFWVVCGTSLAGAAAPARAQLLTADISSDEAYVGELLTVTVTVSNPSQATAPTPPATNDFEIRLVSLQPNAMQRVTVVNGRMTQQADYAYQFSVKPLRSGNLTLGRFTRRDGGRTYATKPIPVTVTPESAGQDVFCEVTAKREAAYIGQPVELSLQIWIRRFHQPGLGMLDVTNTWGLKDMQASKWGVFARTDIAQPKYGTSQRDMGNGRKDDFYVFYLETTAYPTTTGPFDIGDMEFVYNYPIRIGRGVFNLTLERSRKLSVRPKASSLIVKPIPQEGRPPDYNGAIGVYSISATAKPIQVPVGDPITLTLSIRGDGALDRLGPPRLDKAPALTRDFEVSADVPAGEIEANYKRFSLTIRALREDVKQIPPVPLSFFNPVTGKFETAYSKAIPLRVAPAQRLELSHLPPSERGAAESGTLAPLVESTEGLFLNETSPDAILVDQSAALGPVAWSLLAVMPLAYATTSVLCARSARFRRDHAFRRRSRALSTAKKTLGHRLPAGEEPPSPAHVRAALVGYIADRCNVPAGGITRADAVKLLANRAVSPEAVKAADALLEQLELAEYAGATTNAGLADADTARNDLAVAGWLLVQTLEREKLR